MKNEQRQKSDASMATANIVSPGGFAAVPVVGSPPHIDPVKRLRNGERLPSLDGLRGLAVLMVMMFHFMDDPSFDKGMIKPLFLLAHIGQTGVDLFFVLSGFLITGILVDTKDNPHYFRNFYMRRTLRIFPLYYGSLLALYVLLPLLNVNAWWPAWQVGASHQAWQWFYLTNFAIFLNIPQIPGHFWTLAVEEHFYLLWPFIVFSFSPRTLSRICIGIVLAALFIRSLLAWGGLDTFYLTPCRMDALAIGAWLALQIRQQEKLSVLRGSAAKAALCSAVVLLPVYLLATGSHNTFLQATKFLAIGIFYGAVLLWLTLAPGSNLIARWMFCRPLRELGKYSYGLYVFHGFALIVLPTCVDMSRAVRWTHSVLLGIGLWLVIAVTASFLPAYLSWHLYEKRFLKLKRYFAESSSGRKATVA